MARYVQQTPPQPPEYGLKDMKATWKVIVPPEARPKKKMTTTTSRTSSRPPARCRRDRADRRRHQEDHQHHQDGLRGAHIAHVRSGRYLFVIGRDAKINMIDLWMEKPDNVAGDPRRSRGPFGRNLEVQGL